MCTTIIVHFTDDETEAGNNKQLAQEHTVNKWGSQNLNPHISTPEFYVLLSTYTEKNQPLIFKSGIIIDPFNLQ